MYVANYIFDLHRAKVSLPAFHAFGCPAVFYAFENFIYGTSVKPVSVGKVGAYIAFGVIAMTGSAIGFKNILSVQNSGGICQLYIVFVNVQCIFLVVIFYV